MKSLNKKSSKTSVGRIIFRIVLLLLLPVALLLKSLAQNNPVFIENVYSRGFYRAVSGFFSKYFNLFSFSVFEIIIYGLAVFAVFLLAVLIKRLVKKNIKGFFSVLLTCAMVFTSGYFIITAGWGLNYYRVPLEENLGYKSAQPSAKELAAAIKDEVDEINSLSEKINYDSSGVSHIKGGFNKISGEVNNGYTVLQNQNKKSAMLFGNISARPKPVIASELMAYNGIEGIFIPFTYEPNVNVSTPEFMQPFNAAHESAHLKGFAREQEANFVSYLACSENPDAYFKYSAHMAAYMYLANALYETDKTLWKEQVLRLSERAKGDFKAYAEYTEKHKSKAAEISNKINDSYLKSQGQQGVITYDMFVKLLCDKKRTELG